MTYKEYLNKIATPQKQLIVAYVGKAKDFSIEKCLVKNKKIRTIPVPTQK